MIKKFPPMPSQLSRLINLSKSKAYPLPVYTDIDRRLINLSNEARFFKLERARGIRKLRSKKTDKVQTDVADDFMPWTSAPRST